MHFDKVEGAELLLGPHHAMETEISSCSVNHCIGCLRLSVFSLFCQSLSLIVETLMKLLKHLRPFGGIIVVSWTAV